MTSHRTVRAALAFALVAAALSGAARAHELVCDKAVGLVQVDAQGNPILDEAGDVVFGGEPGATLTVDRYPATVGFRVRLGNPLATEASVVTSVSDPLLGLDPLRLGATLGPGLALEAGASVSEVFAVRVGSREECEATFSGGLAVCGGGAFENTFTATHEAGAVQCRARVVCGEGCRNTVLVLASQDAASTAAFVERLTAAGLVATVVPNGSITYDGTPAASAFGSVVILTGDNWPSDMPQGGQEAIVAANAAGTGVVFLEWAAFEVSVGRWATLGDLEILQRDSGICGQATYTREVDHPVWTGLPDSFRLGVSLGTNVGGAILNGGTRIGGCDLCSFSEGAPGAGVVVKDRVGDAGRIVQIAFAPDFNGSGCDGDLWTSDTNAVGLVLNALRWATGCKP